MNVKRSPPRRFAVNSSAAPARVAHRCNRLVLFGARLLHRTGHFAEGYLNKRTNLTFLFA